MTDKLEDIIKKVYQMQGEVLKKNILHPKQEYLWLEINRFCSRRSGSKILVVVPRNLPHLQQSIKTLLCSAPQLSVTVLPDFKSQPMEIKTGNMVCITQYVESMPTTCLSQFSKVIQYDDGLGKFFKTACKNQDCSYVGLVTELLNVPAAHQGVPEVRSVSTPFTLICSSKVSHNKQLLCMLEARYNIFIIERDFSRLHQKGFKHPSADLTFSATHCAMLLSLVEMDHQWNMEKVFKRYLALGLQYSNIFIIAHAIDSTTGYPLGKEAVQNIQKLRASLSNLTRSSDYFDAQYKVLVRLTEADVASCIRSLANMYVASQKETDTERPWLSADMSQQEEALLTLPCLNPFSAQVLLQKLKCTDVLEMSVEEMSQAVPDLPHTTLKFLNHITSAWSLKNKLFSSQTSVSTNRTLDMSFSSSCHSGTSCKTDEKQNSLVNEDLKEKPTEVIKLSGSLGSSSHMAKDHYTEQGSIGMSEPHVSEHPQLQGTLGPAKSLPYNNSDISKCAIVSRQNTRPWNAQLKLSCVPNNETQKSFRQQEHHYDTSEGACLEASDYTVNNTSMDFTVPVEQSKTQSSVDGNICNDVNRFDIPYNAMTAREPNLATCTNLRRKCPVFYQNCPSKCDNPIVSSTYPFLSQENNSGHSEEIVANSNQFTHKHSNFSQAEVSQNVMVKNLAKKSHSNCEKSYLANEVFQLKNSEPPGCHQYKSEVQDLNRYENVGSPVHRRNEYSSSLQYTERSGLSLLNEPGRGGNLLSSADYVERVQSSKAYLHEPAYHIQTPFQGDLDTMFCIKQELTDEETSYSGINPHCRENSGLKQKPLSLSKNAFEKDIKNTYGIFSSTARRNEPDTSPLDEDYSSQPAQIPRKFPSHFEYSDLENNDMYNVGDSPLPFSVSKALKRHILQVEAQNAFKAPRMFQIAQSGGAFRDERITRRLNVDNMQSEITPRGSASEMSFIKHEKENISANFDRLDDPNDFRKSCASREDNTKRLAQIQSFFPLPMSPNIASESYGKLHPLPTEQAWNVSHNRHHSHSYMGRNSSNCQYELCSERSEPSQHQDLSREAAQIPDNHGGLSPLTYKSKEKASHPVGVLSERYKHKANMVRQIQSPDENNFCSSGLLPLNRSYEENRIAATSTFRNQNEIEARSVWKNPDVLRKQSVLKPPNKCLSKWKKYESYSKAHNEGISGLQREDLFPLGQDKSPDNEARETSGFRSLCGNADMSPPMDLSYSPVVPRPMKYDGSAFRRTAEEDSKIRRWQLHLQRQSLASQRGENFSS
ncbi:A-kinase (PRKA) anchor protein (Gravin) 12b [Elysia marginata]|uniref:A-kinase (PRKA) anchor protein (Gravin) 12b n=1 Tax=Elysia marginata TaxID=1093978 RepID=A0AAV4EVH3_9GAST|nr:A-kinase (PRKA) anchor protein (Gravin) 12b [Elysia marginata]